MIGFSAYRRALLGLSLVFSVPCDLVGQSLAGQVAPGQSQMQTQLDLMKLSSRLRLKTGTGDREGRLIFRTADSVGIRGAEGESHLALSAVDSLWVRRHHAGKGFLIGTLVGAGAYIVTTSAISDESEVPELDNVFGGLLWAGSAALGTIVGALIPGWERVYP
jgi:hypothetical protein